MNLFYLLLVSSMAAVGSLLLKQGVTVIGPFTPTVRLIPKIVTNLWIVFGLLIYALSAFLWLSLLSKSELSRLYPIFVAIDFLIVSVVTLVIFKEQFSLIKIIGIILLLLGIYFISHP